MRILTPLQVVNNPFFFQLSSFFSFFFFFNYTLALSVTLHMNYTFDETGTATKVEFERIRRILTIFASSTPIAITNPTPPSIIERMHAESVGRTAIGKTLATPMMMPTRFMYTNHWFALSTTGVDRTRTIVAKVINATRMMTPNKRKHEFRQASITIIDTVDIYYFLLVTGTHPYCLLSMKSFNPTS